MKKVSIILPVYNAEDKIDICISSILNQSYNNIELIIINDGSTDSSLTKINEYLNDKRILLIDKKNEGVSKARNDGIKKSTGDYIQFIDSDDYIHPEMTKQLVNNIELSHADLVVCGYDEITIQNKKTKTVNLPMYYNGSPQELIEVLYQNSLLFMIWNKLYKKEFIFSEFDNELSHAEDILFNLYYFEKCRKITIIPNVLYYYNLSINSGLHLVFDERDLFTNKLIYKMMHDVLLINLDFCYRVYLSSIIRCLQRLVLNSGKEKGYIYNKIQETITDKELQEIISNAKNLNKQQKIFCTLFERKKVKLIYLVYKVKGIILVLLQG